MKSQAKYVAVLLPLLLSGCTHKTNQAQVQQPALAPPIIDNPPPSPATAAKPTDLPPPVLTTPKPVQPATTATTQPPPPPPKPKHKKPAPKPAEQPAAATTQQASSGQAPSVSAIGQLSTGDPADVKTQTQDSIDATEKGLREIGRKLSDQEQKTADQIEEFLKEARKALTTGDVDGAQTLAAKAKVLLGELTQ
jgi:outer membrane biosynthesis protein TonB